VLLSVAPGHAPWAFATLFFLESMARASLSTVLPLHAYDLFGNKEKVSLAYTAVAVLALLASFAIPYMIRLFSRRWSYTVGASMIALSGLLLATDTIPGQLGAMFVRTFGAATLNITLSLYIMDYIHKTQLVHSEPLRFAVSTTAWIVAPLLGVILYERFGVWAASIVPVAGALILISAFWHLRMREKSPIRPGPSKPANPVRSIGRFFAQPRLRVAWLIAFARSAYWVTFFIYVPILMVEGGVGAFAGGIAIAAGNAMLFNNLLLPRWARRYTVRRMLTIALGGGAVFTAACGVAGVSFPVTAGVLMVAAAFFISMLDGLGPIPFMRAVRSHERAQMTTVYRTYLDASELIPPFIYVFAFMAFGFSGAFYVLALLLAVTACITWLYIPQRL
jgi:MFS family permease